MKRLHTIAIFALLTLMLAAVQSATAQRKVNRTKPKSSAPQTVTDFYLLLPEKYFPFFDRVKNRRDLIEGEQIKNGYLSFVGNRPGGMPLDNEMLLLKRMSGVPVLVVAYTNCIMSECEAVLRFVEYEAGRWTEVEAAPKFDLAEMREIYRRRTGKVAEENPRVYYSLSPIDKSLTVNFSGDSDVEIYKLKWDGNIYDYAAPK